MTTQADIDQLKQAAALKAVEQVESGMVVGLGTGSTATFAVTALGERIRAGLQIVGIHTSENTAEYARRLGISLATLAEHPCINLTIDGADEVEVGSLNLIKGLGGALLREKIVASASERLIIIVDQTKLVDRLGSHAPVPIEVVPFGWQATQRYLEQVGALPTLRLKADAEAFVTDEGHYILDCTFQPIVDPATLAQQIACTVGVVESGLFIGLTTQVIVAATGGIQVLSAGENS